MPHEEAEPIGDQLRRLGWRTGSVLTRQHAAAVGQFLRHGNDEPLPLRDDCYLIVVSQTCDIVVPKLELEPYVELLLAELRSKVDRTKANLRSTRYLSFRVTNLSIVLEAHAARRFVVPREVLAEYGPDAERSLDSMSAAKVSMWLALRYSRPAWPEALVRRLKPAMPQLEAILHEVREELAEIRVAISDRDQELGTEVPYRLTVYGLIDSELYDANPQAVESCTTAFTKILTVLRELDGIELQEESDLLPGHEFDWQSMQMTDIWNWANLSALGE